MATKDQVIKRLETLLNKAEELKQIDELESFGLYPIINLSRFVDDCFAAISQLQDRQ